MNEDSIAVLPATLQAIEDRRRVIQQRLEKNTQILADINQTQDGDQMDDTSFRQALDERELLDAQMREIEYLGVGRLINLDEIPGLVSVSIGHEVGIQVRFADGEKETFKVSIVPPLDAKFLPQKVNGNHDHLVISSTTPLGVALIGHNIGETVKYNSPDGEATAKILSLALTPLLNNLEH